LGGVRALTEVFADANAEVVENAVSATNALESLDRCADVPLLRAVVRPPDDVGTRTRVNELRQQLADTKAQFDAGRWKETLKIAPMLVEKTRALGYVPLVAESLLLEGNMQINASDPAAAERSIVEAFWLADASRHDEVRAESATKLVFVVGYQLGRFSDAERWATAATAVLKRLGGHELLQAWLLNDLGCVYDLQGKKEAAVRALKEGLALKERALGREHPDIGVSEGNLGLSLKELGRHQEALLHVERGIALTKRGLGASHPDIATDLSNRGEILNALHRYREARESFEQATAIWEREFGVENLNLGYALTGIGVSYLAEGNAPRALVPLERAFAIRTSQEKEPSRRAETTFALARALWEANRDRGRARSLAERAKETYAAIAAQAKVSEVDRWIASRSDHFASAVAE